MKTRKLAQWSLLLGALMLLGGCAETYSSIRQLEDGSYLITENKAGFFRVSGHVYSCREGGPGLLCKEVSGI